MGRPRRPYNGVEDIVLSGDRFGKRVRPGGLGVRQENRWEASQHWVYPMPNGIFDPMTYMFVLDALVSIDPDITLRAANLVEHLRTRFTQVGWDAITVGKVLADIHDVFEDVLGEKVGLLEQGVDYRGKWYYIHLYPDAVALYHSLREELMLLTKNEMDKRKFNSSSPEHKVGRMASPLNECPSTRGEWKAAI